MDEELSFEDRFAEVPETPVDDETEAKKLELLKLVQQGILPPPDLVVPKPNSGPSEDEKEILRAAGKEGLKAGFKHAAETGQPITPYPIEPEVEIEAAKTRSIEPPPPEPVDLGKMSAAIRPAEGFQPEPSPSKDIDILVRGGIKPAPKGSFAPEVEAAIAEASKSSGIPLEFLRAVAKIESGGNPESNRGARTQYKGLYQFGTRTKGDTWGVHGQGDVYNARDNAMAMTRLLEANRKVFRGAMGRDPTLPELYLMHQQGPGFFTKGSLINPAGNLPKGARTAENMTHEGFRRWWTARVNRAIADAGGSAKPYVPTEELAPFMSPESTASRRAELTGGLSNTPERAAQVAALMHGTPIEKIAAAAQNIRAAGVRGRIRGNEATVTPGARVATPRVSHTEMPQAVIPGAEGATPRNTMPIPGMNPNEYPMITEALNPSVMSTINAYRGQLLPAAPVEPAPQVAAPSDIAQKPSFLSNAMKLAGYLGTAMQIPVNPAAIGQLAVKGIVDATRGTLPTVPSGEEAGGFVRGVGSGVAQQPTDMAMGTLVPLISAGGLLTGSEGAKDVAVEGIQGNEDWRAGVRGFFGVDPVKQSPAETAGETLGRNLNPVNFAKTLMNLAGSYVGELAQPTISKLAHNYPIQNVFSTPAQAASIFGAPPRVVQTPGGPVVMNDASLSEFVYGGIAALGFGFAPGVYAKTSNYLRTNPTVMWVPNPIVKYTDPRRMVPGASGTVAASLPRDMLKAGIVDTNKTMMDIADRQARYEKGSRVGLDPVAATEVEHRLKVQTGSGLQNMTNQTVTIGEMRTEAHAFKVNTPLSKIQEFASANPDFNHYLKARIIHEQIYANMRHNAALAAQVPAPGQFQRKTRPTDFEDIAGNRWTNQSARDTINWLDRQNPQFRRAYRDYRENIYETQRFLTEGPNHLENGPKLTVEAVKRPSLPIFSQRENIDTLMTRVLNDDSPLAILEDRMKQSIGTMLKNDAHLAYIQQVGSNASFTPRDAAWLKRNGALAGNSVIDFKVDGQRVSYTTDPFIAGLMRSDHAPAPSSISKALSVAKKPFTITTTGWAAPWFVVTALARAMEQGMTTAPIGLRRQSGIPVMPAGPFSSLAGIGAKLYPQMARALVPPAQWFESLLNSGPLTGMGGTNLISRTLQKAYMDSFYRRMEVGGAFSANPHWDADKIHNRVTQLKNQYRGTNLGPIMNYMANANSHWQNFIEGAGRVSHTAGSKAFHAYDQTRVAIGDSPAWGYVWKAGRRGNPYLNGRQISDAELGAIYRAYTGDPGTKGSIYTKDRRGDPTTLEYQGVDAWKANLYKHAGGLVSEMRHFVPWMDILIQSPAKTIRALKENPVRAGLAFTATGALPEMVAFLWNQQQGQQYLDYQFNQRSSYNLDNFIYVAKPGRPPHEGIEVPINQETIFTRAGTRAFMRQWAGISNQNTFEDVNHALLGFLGQTFIPPAPPLVAGIYTGLTGKIVPQGAGFITGQSFSGRQNQLDPTGNSNFEKMLRQWGAGLADIGLHFRDAYSSSPKGDVWQAVDAGARAAGHRAVSKTTLVRDIIGYRPPVTGSPEINDELFKKSRFIQDVTQFMNTWDTRKGGISAKGFGLKPEGKAKARDFIAEPPPVKGDMIPNPGVSRDLTKNPLWNMTVKEIKKTFDEDGQVGYKSMWKNYSIYSQMVRRMYKVNTGNEQQWIEEQKKNPELIGFLKKYKVDPNDFRAVRDFYNLQRQKTGQQILYAIKATEQRINKNPQVKALLKGKEFKVEMLSPEEESIDTE